MSKPAPMRIAKSLIFVFVSLVLLVGLWEWFDRRFTNQTKKYPVQYVKTLSVDNGPAELSATIGEIEAYLTPTLSRRLYRTVRSFFFENMWTFSSGIANRKFTIAYHKLQEGETEAAIKLFEQVRNYYENNPASLTNPRLRAKLISSLSIAYMRQGEQQNCLNNPNGAVCIVPFNKDAVHQLRDGSTKALDIFQNVNLKENPDDFASKWLLNMAFITLGEHPKNVPAQHLLPIPGLIPNYDGTRFRNISEILGVADVTSAGSVALEDFNGDGLIDIFVTEWKLSGRVKLYLRKPDGTFHDATSEAGLTNVYGGLNVIHGDYNNDGFSDIYVIRGAWRNRRGIIPNSLLQNNGDGTFTDVTVKAGVLGYFPTITSAFADLNNDGWLDLVVANETVPGSPSANILQLFLNNQDGTFTDHAKAADFEANCHAKAVAIADFDNNRTQDVFISCMGSENLLFSNQKVNPDTAPVFKEIANIAGVQMPLSSFASWFWDFDNDGDQDLFVAGYGAADEDAKARTLLGAMGGSTDPAYSSSIMARSFAGQSLHVSNPKLYSNNGDGTFSDVTQQANLDRPYFAMGANFGDFDNDGWLDIYLGTGAPSFHSIYPNAALRNLNGKVFQEITGSSGLGHIQKGHGLAFADFDQDGDQDIFAEMGGAFNGDVFQNALFENIGNSNNWIKLELVGTNSNRSSIGARIEVHIKGSNGTNRVIHRTIGSGGSFGSAPFRSEIGLGGSAAIEHAMIYWPTSGLRQKFTDLRTNKAYRIVEGKAVLEPLNQSIVPFRALSGNRAHNHH